MTETIAPNPPFASQAPDTVGLTPDFADRLDLGVRAGLLRDLHGVAVARRTVLAAERYWPGVDEAWGRPVGDVAHGPDTLHDLRSITKSIVSILYGIALDRGMVPPPEAPLYAAFPELADLAADPARAAITIEHALTMTMGLEWDEMRPYSDPENSETAMERADDRLRFVLSRPIVAEPGSEWRYSGGASAAIGLLIERGVGQSLDSFAREALFEPIGIGVFEWAKGADGVVAAASGLRLTMRDLLRLGLLVLDGGAFDGRRVVSESWLEASFRPAKRVEFGIDYGYFWWLADGTPPPPGWDRPSPWIGAFGNGGQRLFVSRETGFMAAISAGAYNRFDAWVSPTRVWREMTLTGASSD